MIYFAYSLSQTWSMASYALAIQQKDKEFFKFQKKIIKTVSGSESGTSCKPLFHSLQKLALPSQYTLSLIKFSSHNVEIH
jgi:hypothetical protein